MLECYLKNIGLDGAGEETQTPGLFLGKEALYQLSYTRTTENHYILESPLLNINYEIKHINEAYS